ncbi:Electron transfer flavoprotein alpha/beta- subunit [Catenulispora acidiphila DSM 44928]|uniref:Electron transfer flavoprotein subunit beta n=1 Tax=Catenulispora acidiphila (strain DSM 44928 / JCM 14897 / NBRC 102108 / NRRL B-24433 / ID139908) TaxID=479433 RepID=C7Q7D4_CATAD|nr:electron transfer flavoprotein subunit beta/FixA family protein [Catenulispora acidiphila]ACU70222.1 Electron transfer flavoprotein alpha/beta- subunit [Catenulispora acidiphila DSM 44928]
MKVVVCVKQVPDTEAEKRLLPDTLTVDRESSNPVLNEMDEFAIEEALKLVEAHGGEVVVLTMGPDGADAAVRKALSMGADSGILLSDPALAGSDAAATSYAIAQALGTTEFDLVILGSEASDARTSLVPAMLAERLGLPQLTFASKVEIDGTDITVNRLTDYGHDVVKATLPAVVSVVEKINEPRYPSFKGIMAAKKKPIAQLDAAAAGIDAAQVGAAGAWTAVADAAERPPRSAGVKVADEGDGGVKLAEFLSAQKFI